LLVCTVYSVLYSEIALSLKPFGIGHKYTYKFLLRMAHTMTSKNIDLPSWDILYILLTLHIKFHSTLGRLWSVRGKEQDTARLPREYWHDYLGRQLAYAPEDPEKDYLDIGSPGFLCLQVNAEMILKSLVAITYSSCSAPE
jgi:hypothetical protein